MSIVEDMRAAVVASGDDAPLRFELNSLRLKHLEEVGADTKALDGVPVMWTPEVGGWLVCLSGERIRVESEIEREIREGFERVEAAEARLRAYQEHRPISTWPNDW